MARFKRLPIRSLTVYSMEISSFPPALQELIQSWPLTPEVLSLSDGEASFPVLQYLAKPQDAQEWGLLRAICEARESVVEMGGALVSGDGPGNRILPAPEGDGSFVCDFQRAAWIFYPATLPRLLAFIDFVGFGTDEYNMDPADLTLNPPEKVLERRNLAKSLLAGMGEDMTLSLYSARRGDAHVYSLIPPSKIVAEHWAAELLQFNTTYYYVQPGLFDYIKKECLRLALRGSFYLGTGAGQP